MKKIIATPLAAAAISATAFSGAFGASLRGSTVTLCYRGYTTDGSSCTSYAKHSCDTGFYRAGTGTDTFTALFNERCITSTTKRTFISSEMYPIYNGTLMGGTVTLCDNNTFSTDGTTCTAQTQGRCNNGYYQAPGTTSTFTALFNDRCVTSTRKVSLLSDFYAIHTGTLMGNAVTLCDGGYSTNGSSCTAYSTGTCPGNLKNVPMHTNTILAKTGASCTSGYRNFTAEEECKYTPTQSFCVNVCDSGSLYTSLGSCAPICTSGATTLRTSTGVVLPMWGTAQTTPAVNIGLGEDVCYVNLVPGAVANDTHTIMIQYDNNLYHAVE